MALARTIDILKDEAVGAARVAIAAAVDAQPDALKKLQVAGGLAAGAIGAFAGVLADIDHGLKGEGLDPYTDDALTILKEMLGDADPDHAPVSTKWLAEAVFASEK